MLSKLNQLIDISSKRVVAIDISGFILRVVEVDFSQKTPTITNFDVVSFPVSHTDFKEKKISQEKVSELLRDTLQRLNVEAKDAAFLISGGSIFSRKIKIPKLPPKELEGGIRWEASNQIPFNLDNSHFDWFFLREVELADGIKNNEYMIAASTKKIVDDMVAMSLEFGFHPCCVGIPVSALYNLISVSEQFSAEEKIAVIDIGAKRTNIIIVEQNNMIFARELPVGDDNFNDAIINEFDHEQWDLAQVEEAKKRTNIFSLCLSSAGLSGDEVTQRMINVIRPLMENFLNEIKRSFDYFREHHQKKFVGKVVLSGKGAEYEGIAEAFRKNFNIPVEFFNISSLFTARSTVDVNRLNAHVLELTVLLGLAFGKANQINFVPMQYKEHKQKSVQSLIALAGSLVVFLFFAFFVVLSLFSLNGLRNDIKESNKKMSFILPQLEAFNQSCAMFKRDKVALDSLRDRQLMLSGAMRALSHLVPRAISFKELTLLNEGWIRIEGFVFDDVVSELTSETVLTDFIIAIENSIFFAEVKLVSSERGDKFEVPYSLFAITCRVVSRKEIKEV